VQATKPLLYGFPHGMDLGVYELVEATGGFAGIDAGRIGLRAAVESAFFAAVASSWSCSSFEEGRIKVCARVCGVDFPAYQDQFEASELVPGST
jgi:hypothetical protein